MSEELSAIQAAMALCDARREMFSVTADRMINDLVTLRKAEYAAMQQSTTVSDRLEQRLFLLCALFDHGLLTSNPEALQPGEGDFPDV